MVKNKNIVLAVTGGIAVYKACTLTSQLTQMGANVKVIMTESATKFVSPLTFQALSRNEVFIDTFIENTPENISHIDVADWADIVLIAPATANTISKLAQGIADDMVTTTLLATEAPVFIAPAMNVHMYAHPAVATNIKTLKEWGYTFIEPGAGYLACGYVGKGRMEEPEAIIHFLVTKEQNSLPLLNKNVLISAGPTVEQIDPVRFFSNRSSGKMGYAIAEVAANLGATVTLVSGPVHEKTQNKNINIINVTSASEMAEAMKGNFNNQDIVIKAAAVADYRPKTIQDQKIKKLPGDWSIELERTEDILKSLGDMKTNQYLVGFAAESNDVIE